MGYLVPGGSGHHAPPQSQPAATNGARAATRARAERIDRRPVLERLRDGAESLWWGVQDPDRRGWILAGAIAVFALTCLAGYYYFREMPDKLADDYRDRAQPAAAEITASMDKVYKGFDQYLDEIDVPLRRLRNAEDYDEYRRRAVPILNDVVGALQASQAAINAARLAIEQNQGAFGIVPSAPLLGGSGPIAETENAQRLARDYLVAAASFLADYEDFIAYERSSLAITRRDLANEPKSNGCSSAISCHRTVRADLGAAKRIRRAFIRLDPPTDAEKIDDIQVEGATIEVDFYEDLLAGIENLNRYQILDAYQDYIPAAIRNARDEVRAQQAFAAHSNLQDTSIRLTEMADELEDTIAELGSGRADPDEPGRTRKRPPSPSPSGGGGGGGSEGEGEAA